MGCRELRLLLRVRDVELPDVAFQEMYFDRTGLLHRHDYTAEVVGSWAGAIHLCDDYRQFGGLRMPTTRRVYPKGPFNRPLPFPTLVAIDVHDAQPRPA